MVRLNDLIARHGMTPADVVATLDSREGDTRILVFSGPPDGPDGTRRFSSLLKSLGIADNDRLSVIGTDRHLLDTLDRALKRASEPRSR